MRRGTVTESWREEQHCKLNKSIFNLQRGYLCTISQKEVISSLV